MIIGKGRDHKRHKLPKIKKLKRQLMLGIFKKIWKWEFMRNVLIKRLIKLERAYRQVFRVNN